MRQKLPPDIGIPKVMIEALSVVLLLVPFVVTKERGHKGGDIDPREGNWLSPLNDEICLS